MRSLLLVVAFCLSGAAAYAQTDGLGQALDAPRSTPQAGDVEDTLRSFGLMGTWSIDCSQPKGTNNAHIYFRKAGGKIVQVHDNGGRHTNNYEILEATKLDSDRLRVKAHFSNAQASAVNNLEWVVRDKRMRTFSNTAENGDRIVVDGVVVSVKRETPWLTRCD